MPFDRTITEDDLDAAGQQFVQEHPSDALSREADLDVDGLEDSVGSRILGLSGG